MNARVCPLTDDFGIQETTRILAIAWQRSKTILTKIYGNEELLQNRAFRIQAVTTVSGVTGTPSCYNLKRW